MRRRVALYIALALCIPLPAFALSGDGPAQAKLSVEVELDRCALVESRILCKLDLSFDRIDGATSYTASVAQPNGAVIDLGEIGPSPTSVWVPYAGNGTYSVEVSAYGEPDDPEGEAKLLDRDRGVVMEDDDEEAVADRDQGRSPDGDGADGDDGDAPEGIGGEGTDAGGAQGGASPDPSCAEAAEEGEEGEEAEDEAGQEVRDEDGEAIPHGEEEPGTISPCPR